MNLPVIISKALNTAKGLAGNGLLLAKKHAPEIMIGTGIIGFGATVVETVKATNKTNDILNNRDKKIQIYDKELRENPDGYSEKNYAEDVEAANRQAKWSVAKAWAPVVTFGGASVVSILGGYRILNGRYVATAAAYKVLENRFDRYRGNVLERFGKDVDWQMANDVKAEDLEKAQQEREENRKIDEENKGKKLIKKRKKTAYQDVYQCIFDEYSDRWQRYWTPELTLEFLKQVQREMNDLLRIRKHLFVNEVYDRLGLERTAEGAVTGWILTRNNPNSFVSLGIDDMPAEELRQILGTRRNEDIRVKIRLNPDGLIYQMIDGPRNAYDGYYN